MIHILTTVKTEKFIKTTVYTIRFTKDELLILIDGLTKIRLPKKKQTKLESDLRKILKEVER